MTTQELSEDAQVLCERIVESQRPVIFLLGSPLTQPETNGSPGVANVETVTRRLREILGDRAGTDFAEAFEQAEAKKRSFAAAYKLGFKALIRRKSQDHANAVIRKAVLDAYVPLSDQERETVMSAKPSHVAACKKLSSPNRIGGWHLRESVTAVGQILASNPEGFPQVWTTNFDPLIEVAITKAKGAPRRSVLLRDGNPMGHAGDGTHVLYVHGYWYGADTLHTDSQLQAEREQLENTLREWAKSSKIVVLGYGGWDDVLMSALSACARNGNAQPEIDWAFYGEAEAHVVEALGEAGSRFQAFEQVDLHRFLPALRDALAIDAGKAGLGPREEERRAQWLEPPYKELAPSPDLAGFRLLVSRHGVVPFAGRDELVGDFAEWVQGGGLKVRLVTGQGGQGKTRLLRELCKTQIDAGWVAGVLCGPESVGSAVAEVHAGRACLFTVDYAEAWGNPLVELLTALHRAAEADGSRTVRVVLAARAEADWWDVMREAASEVLALDALDAVVPLPPPAGDAMADWQEAVSCFRAARGEKAGPVTAAAEADLAAWLKQGVLTVHVAALLASDGDLPAGATRREVLFRRLLARESRLWKAKGEEYAEGVANLDRVLAKVAAIGTLVGPIASEADAREWVGRVPGTGGLSEPQLDGLARVFAEMYPRPEAVALPPVQPDRIGEFLVKRAVGDEERLASLAFEHGDRDQAAQALRVLGRAARWNEDAAGGFIRVATEQPIAFMYAWVEVAQYESWALAAAREVEVAVGMLEGLPPEEANALCRDMPLESVALRGIAVTLAKRAVQGVEAAVMNEAARADLARRLDTLGTHLSLNGQRKEALEATSRAVQHYEMLHGEVLDEAFAEVVLWNLAMSLNNLGIRCAELRMREAALDASRRAVSYYEVLAEIRPDGSRADLAMSLNNLGNAYYELKRPQEAESAIRRAVSYYEELMKSGLDVFRGQLAMSLNNLGNAYSELGKPDEALAVTRCAAEHYEVLAEARADAFLPDLAMSLCNLGNRYSELGKQEEALEATSRAVEHYKVLAGVRPNAFLARLSDSLNNLGIVYARLRRTGEALEAACRAVEICEGQADTLPDVFKSRLVNSLTLYGRLLTEAGASEEARAVAVRLQGLMEDGRRGMPLPKL